MNRLSLFFLTAIFYFCTTPSDGQNIPSWKVYYDSTQIVWDKDWGKAISLLTKAEQYALIDLGLYDENYLAIISDLGLANWRAKNYNNAEKFFKRTIELKSEISGDNPEFYSLMNNLAGLYAEQEKWTNAKALYKNILNHDPASVETALYTTALKNMLAVYDAEGYSDSILYVLETDKIKRYIASGNDGPLTMEMDLFQARAFRKRKNYNEARVRLESLFHKLSGQDQSPLYMRVLQEAGMVDLETGSYSKAERNFLQAYRQLKSMPLPDHVLLTTLLNNLAYVYDKLSIYDKALAYYQESLNVCQLSYSVNSLPCTTLQSNIAGIYLKQDKAQEAIRIYKSLLERFKEIVAESSLLYITALNNLSTAYRINNDYDNATNTLNQAYDLVKKYKLDKEDIAATVLNNLAVLHTASGSLVLAASYAEKAYAIKRSIYGEQSVLLLDLVSNMAIVYWALNDLDHALPLLDKSIQLSIRQIKYVFPALNEREQIQFYKKLKDDFERFNTIACGLGATHPALITQMFNNQIMIKSLIFFTQQRRSVMIVEKKDSVLNVEYENLRTKREQLGYLYQLPLSELRRVNISPKNLEVEIDRLEKNIMLKTSEDLTASGLAENVQWSDVQPALQPQEAVVEVIRFRKYELRRQETTLKKNTSFGFTDSIYYAALITTSATKDHPSLILMKEGNDMETRFLSYYRNALTFDVTDDNSYPYYWKPIESALDDRTHVFFSGDGVYHKLNLNTLRQTDSAPYLLQRYDIHQLSNPAQYLDKKKSHTNNTAVLIGDPVFDLDITNITRSQKNAGAEFSALPGTYAEIKAISEILNAKSWKTTVFLKAHATERNLKRIHSPGLLHIATHGFFSADVISLNEEAKNDFLFHSGLILSGANKYIHEEMQPAHDDGIVTAYEVMNLDLSHTDLVVLSACETGLGKIENGEGVYGLQRSFLQAGARNVLISLWKVDDAATKELMIKFYTFLSKGFSKRESLKLAELDQMRRVKNPMEWGGFVLVGAD